MQLKEIYVSKHVVFDEISFPGKDVEHTNVDEYEDPDAVINLNDVTPLFTEEPSDEEIDQSAQTLHEHSIHGASSENSMTEEIRERRYPDRVRLAPDRL